MKVFLQIGILFILCSCRVEQDKTAYVRIHYLYDNFEGKKEQEADLIKLKERQQYVLDSMFLELQVLSSAGKENVESKEKLFQQVKVEFVNDMNAQVKASDEKIWTQINQYTEEYGRKNDFTYIYGVEGNGTLMYADTAKDISNKVLKFINDKYKGY